MPQAAATITTVALGPGVWDVFGMGKLYHNGATFSQFAEVAVSNASGSSDVNAHYNVATLPALASPQQSTGTVPCIRAVLSAASSTYYLKMLTVFTGGPPQIFGSIYARRYG